MAEQRLLMISRDDILRLGAGEQGDRFYRMLARLTRSGFQLLATAPQPDDWSRDHGGPDDALLGPDSIRKRLADAGGILDGIYYVPRSLFTQRRNREQALQDILERYAIRPVTSTVPAENSPRPPPRWGSAPRRCRPTTNFCKD